jgi:hypothetical protein
LVTSGFDLDLDLDPLPREAVRLKALMPRDMLVEELGDNSINEPLVFPTRTTFLAVARGEPDKLLTILAPLKVGDNSLVQ